MKAMILAAGRGERMKPLTDVTPKPLLEVAGIPLIEHHVMKLAAAGFNDIIINHAWLGHKIESYLGSGERWGVNISYSREGDKALETAGGIIKALPDLCENEDTFLVINGDVYTDYHFTDLPVLPQNALAYLWLVPNPEHNKQGDFGLQEQRVCTIDKKINTPTYTFSGIALYRIAFFDEQGKGEVKPLGPLLRSCAELGKIAGDVLRHKWVDVGTPERLHQLNQEES